MTKLEIFKAALGFTVGAGVSQIISGVVDSLVPQDTMPQKVCVFAGKMGISMVVSEVVKNKVNDTVDETAVWIKTNISGSGI